MNKKIRYREPEMPESLKSLLDIDIDDELMRGKRVRKTKNAKKAKKGSPSKSRNAASKPLSKKSTRPSKSKTARPNLERKSENVSGKNISKEKASNARAKTGSSQSIKKTRPSEQNVSKNVNKRPQGASRSATRKNVSSRVGVDQPQVRKKQTQQSAVNPNKRVPNSAQQQDRKKQRAKVSNSRDRVQKPNKKKRKSSKGIKYFFSVIVSAILVVIEFLFGKDSEISPSAKDKKKNMDFKFYRNLSLGSVMVLLVIMFVIVFHKDSKVSVAENRELQQKPGISTSEILSGDYSKDYSKYLSDQFPNRTGFIKLKAKFDLALGNKEINGVYIGKDGYLIEGFKKSDKESTISKVESINSFAAANPKIKFSFMLVPNKVEIYKNLMPNNAPVDSQSEYISEVKSLLSDKVKLVNPTKSLNSLKNNDNIYFKTDHHWTVDGAYIAYSDYCKAMDLQAADLSNTFNKSLATDKYYGSLYYKNGAQIGKAEDLYLYLQQGNNPLIVKYYDTKKKVPSLYDVSKLEGRDPYEVFTGGNHTQIKIRTNVETDKKLLLIKDSYANAMLPFLVNNYAEINVIDLRYFSGSLKEVLNNNDVTDVLILNGVNTFNSDSSILNIKS
ncbi:DHHW family protein [Peptostreptococcus faecalis]|uniref:DHHW family protein n=1 Tax=Peptostreptococcus faecalis TaxID=2045015 RepID=UPI000C7C2A78|nr:DHHW family protein [Peptostreptococcus faecalis]